MRNFRPSRASEEVLDEFLEDLPSIISTRIRINLLTATLMPQPAEQRTYSSR